MLALYPIIIETENIRKKGKNEKFKKTCGKISADVCNALCRNSASAKYESGLGSRWQHDGTFSGCRAGVVCSGGIGRADFAV